MNYKEAFLATLREIGDWPSLDSNVPAEGFFIYNTANGEMRHVASLYDWTEYYRTVGRHSEWVLLAKDEKGGPDYTQILMSMIEFQQRVEVKLE